MVKMPAQITVLDDFDESVNMLVYGDSGVGKTVLAGTASNGLFLATERGIIAAKRQGSTAKLWRCISWEDVEAAYKWLRDNPDHGFDWVMIDSLTEFQQHILRWILDRAVVESKGNRDPDIPAIQDHQKWQNMYKRYVRLFNDLPVNVLYTATAFRKTDQEGEDIVLPDIVGKDWEISQWTCAAMHVVGFYQVRKAKTGENAGERQRRLLCENTPPIFAKDRYDVLIPYVVNPTMDVISKKIGQPISPRATKALPARPAKAAPRRRTSTVTPIRSARSRAAAKEK